MLSAINLTLTTDLDFNLILCSERLETNHLYHGSKVGMNVVSSEWIGFTLPCHSTMKILFIMLILHDMT